MRDDALHGRRERTREPVDPAALRHRFRAHVDLTAANDGALEWLIADPGLCSTWPAIHDRWPVATAGGWGGQWPSPGRNRSAGQPRGRPPGGAAA